MCESRVPVRGKPAVFLDRDGVLCVEKGYVTRIQELEIFPYARKCIQSMHQGGYLAICITNQSAVGRGMMPEDTLMAINDYLVQELGLDALYYCPHLPPGVDGNMPECSCRKPNTGMVDEAVRRFGIDRHASYMVGDRATDIQCGQKAGLQTVLLESGYGIEYSEQLVKPDDTYRDLEEFVRCCLTENRSR